MPVKNVVAGLDRKDFFTGGSILEVETYPAHPVMAGVPDRMDVFVWRSPVFTTLDGFKGAALAKYRKNGSPLRSGYLLGEEHLQCYAAAMDVHHGAGHVSCSAFVRNGEVNLSALSASCSTPRFMVDCWRKAPQAR